MAQRPRGKKATPKKTSQKRSARTKAAAKRASGKTTRGDKSRHDLIQQQVSRHEFGNRTRSAALLAWFLEHVWRLDPDEIEDAICDGTGDKGIDGLVVNEDAREIEVFQSAHVQSPTKTQGDAKVKQFRGSATYFRDAASVDALLESEPNEELQKLIERNRVRDRLGDGEGWTVRMVYVTDARADDSALDYVAATAGDVPTLELWDLTRLHPVAERTAARELLDVEVTFKVEDSLLHDLGDGKEMAVAIVPAHDLVRLPGIDNLTVFDLNVRLSLGRSRINRDLGEAVRTTDDHAMFPAYHNGMTLLTRELDADEADGELALHGVSVVNGCQSLLALYENRGHITEDLGILVKIVQLGGDHRLAKEITYRSNNQNPVNFRDQRSTDATQNDLQRQVNDKYGDRLFYRIREGEPHPDDVDVLDNRVAAQLLMAVEVGEPHRAVRKVRLFDKEYHRVFTKEVDADRLLLLHMLDKAAAAHRDELRPELAAAFASVRFTILSLTAGVVAESDLGEQLLAEPGWWLPDKIEEVAAELDRFTQDVIDTVNFHVEEEEEAARKDGQTYDPKVVFKSAEGVRRLRQRALQDAKRAARRDERVGEAYEFTVEPAR